MTRQTLSLAAALAFALACRSETATAQSGPPAAGYFRIYNGFPLDRSEWAPAGLPFAKGALAPTGSVEIQGVRYPFKMLERWADGSVRRALIDYPVQLVPYEERTVSYTPSALPAVGGFLPAIPAMTVQAIVNGTTITFDNWQTTFMDATRWEGACHKELGDAMSGITLDLYSTAWSGQSFGRVTLVVGNDWKVRSTASAFDISSLSVKFDGAFAAPLFQWAHNIQAVIPWQEFEFPALISIGDAARWGTTFTWASPTSNLTHAYAASVEPLFGYPEPATEDAANAYGLYGRLKLGMLPDSGPNPTLTRPYWDNAREAFLATCPNTPWTNHGYWMMQEGTTGAYADWGPAPTLVDDVALTPRGIHRMLMLSLSRMRTPDHYRVDAWNEFPAAGAFLGWISAPYRQSADYFQHINGSNGWSGLDEAHREENFRLRAYELTGEHHIYVELQASAAMACLRAKPGGGSGEGRDIARCLQRKVIAWLIGKDADRANIASNLVPWSAWLDQTYPSLNLPTGPLYGLSIISPGNSKYGTHGFDPMGLSYLFFPYSESHVSGTLAIAASLTEIPALTAAAAKSANGLAMMCLPNGLIYESMLENGTGFFPQTAGLWVYPGLAAFRDTDPKIEAAAAAVEALYQNSTNFDELAWMQPF